MKTKKPLILIILDGFGIREEKLGNAIYYANTPNIDKIFSENPYITLKSSGEDVGLPEGQMGNSEVGHLNIGAGRIVYQDLTRINKSIKEGSFYKNEEILSVIKKVNQKNSSLHIMGLLSDGGVHSHIKHLFAILKMVKENNVKKVYIHVWLDGRDTPPNSGINYIKMCENKIKEYEIGKIATISGRYYAMDRDNRWERIKKSYEAIANAKGEKFEDPKQTILDSYKNEVTDEFFVPKVNTSYEGIKENDGIICFNFRPDRAREITRCFIEKDFSEFEVSKIKISSYLCMTTYNKEFKDVSIIFKPQKLNQTLGEYISNKGLKQLRIAETEKYAHVTFFFNGGIEKPYPREDRILIPSPKVSTYDLKPEMSANEITKEVIKNIESEKYDIIILNYANCDMVGHTGNFDAAVKAVETVDKCLKQVVDSILTKNGVALITADHGNAEKMINKEGKKFTSHTTNNVPLCIVNYPCNLKKDGKISDIAPTILKILDLSVPKEISGKNLIM